MFPCKGLADSGVSDCELRGFSANCYPRKTTNARTRVSRGRSTRNRARETRAEIASAPRRESTRKSSSVELIFFPPSLPFCQPRRAACPCARARTLLSSSSGYHVSASRTSGFGYLGVLRRSSRSFLIAMRSRLSSLGKAARSRRVAVRE